MRKLLTISFIAFSTLHVHAQKVSAKDSTEISSKISDWNHAWKVKDYKLATKWYTAHAEFTNAFGQHKIGQQQIESLLNEVFQLSFVMAGDSKVASQKMMLISKDVVLVITTIERAGQQTPDGTSLGIRRTTHHRLFKKYKQWLIVGHLISDARDEQAPKH